MLNLDAEGEVETYVAENSSSETGSYSTAYLDSNFGSRRKTMFRFLGHAAVYDFVT